MSDFMQVRSQAPIGRPDLFPPLFMTNRNCMRQETHRFICQEQGLYRVVRSPKPRTFNFFMVSIVISSRQSSLICLLIARMHDTIFVPCCSSMAINVPLIKKTFQDGNHIYISDLREIQSQIVHKRCLSKTSGTMQRLHFLIV